MEGIAGHLGFLLLDFQLAVLGISVQKYEIGAPASSNSAWHFFVLLDLSCLYRLLSTAWGRNVTTVKLKLGEIPSSAAFLIALMFFDVGSMAQDSPQLSGIHWTLEAMVGEYQR